MLNVEFDLCILYKIFIWKLILKVGRLEYYIIGIKFENENLVLLLKINIGMNKKYFRNRFKVFFLFIWVYKICIILVKLN